MVSHLVSGRGDRGQGGCFQCMVRRAGWVHLCQTLRDLDSWDRWPDPARHSHTCPGRRSAGMESVNVGGVPQVRAPVAARIPPILARLDPCRPLPFHRARRVALCGLCAALWFVERRFGSLMSEREGLDCCHPGGGSQGGEQENRRSSARVASVLPAGGSDSVQPFRPALCIGWVSYDGIGWSPDGNRHLLTRRGPPSQKGSSGDDRIGLCDGGNSSRRDCDALLRSNLSAARTGVTRSLTVAAP